MNNLKYSQIKGPKKSVGDYLQSLNNDELQTVYTSSFLYNVKMPDLMKKMQHELHKRKMTGQPALF